MRARPIRKGIAAVVLLGSIMLAIPQEAEAGRAANCSRPSSAIVAKSNVARKPNGDGKYTATLDCSGAIHIASYGTKRHFGGYVDQSVYNLITSTVARNRPRAKDGGNTYEYNRELGCRAGGGMRVYYSYTVTVVVDARNGRIITAYVSPKSVDKRTFAEEVAYCAAYAASHG